MRLLILTHSLSSGGAERVTSSLANYWSRKGWAVNIVTIAGLEKDFYSLHSNIRRVALRLDKPSENIWYALSNNFRRIRQLRALIKREQPDVVLGMMSTASVLVSLAACKTGIPAIGSERTYPPAMPLGAIWERLRRYSYQYLGAVVVQTDQGAAWIREHTKACFTAVIPNPITFPLEAHKPRIMPSNPGRILLAVGRLGEEKRFDWLIEAFAELAGRFTDWSLVIVGEGICRAKLEKQAEVLGLARRVSLPGAVGNIGEWYESADLYVMTSRFEGFPNTLAEALSYGLPAVSVDCDTGPRDIIRHGVDGLLVPPNDQWALVDALASLMANEDLRDRYGQRAKEAVQRFALERVAEMWENLFRQVMVNGSR